MKLMKSLILSSTAMLMGASAQAADLPVKAKAVEYVKICSLYGAGFYYIPGTDTCMKIGGYLRVDVAANGSDFNGAFSGVAGAENRLRNYYVSRSRTDFFIDTRTATEYGVLRTFGEVTTSWTSGTDAVAGGSLGIYYAFIQFAGFTIGKSISQFSMPWTNYPANNFDGLAGGGGDVTGVNQLTYTFQLGNGVSVALSAQDATPYYQANLWNTSAATVAGVATGSWGTNTFAGNRAPDLVVMAKVDQAWGSVQGSFAAHDVTAGYYSGTGVAAGLSGTELAGHPTDKWGFALQLGASFNLPMLGAGDTLNISGVYTKGASRYDFQDLAPQTWAMYGGSGTAYQSLGLAGVSDAVFSTGGDLQLTETYGFRAGLNHNWDPHWSSGLYGAWAWVNYNGTATAAICSSAALTAVFTGTCNPNFNYANVGFITRWTPVKNFTISGDVAFSKLNQGFVGTWTLPAQTSIGKPAAVYEAKNQDTVTFMARAQRNF
jgi:hypothetical protein